MTSNEVFNLIEKIAAESSKNGKVALLAAHKDDATLRRVLHAALDPFTTYGIAKRPSATTPAASVQEFDAAGTWHILGNLADRTLSGNAAIDAVKTQLENLHPDSAELFWRIVSKDLRAGFGENTVNKVMKDLIPDFPYMRCCLPKDAKLDKFDWKTGVLSQEKADGMFANVDHEADGLIGMRTRQGTPFPLDPFAALTAEVKACLRPGTQTHGEILVGKGGVICAREIGNGILNHVLSGGDFAPDEEPLFVAWDQIPLTAVVPKGRFLDGYRERYEDLKEQVAQARTHTLRMIPTKTVHSLPEAYAHYAELLAQGREGTVFKDPRAIWRDGTSKEQVKLKLEVVVELEVIGFNEGTGKNVGSLGSFICQSSDGGLLVNVSGRGDAMRAEVWANRDKWGGAIISVKANGVMPGDPLSLFLPIFVERRTDKSVADSTQSVRDQFAAAIKGEPLKEAA